jgi:7-keto-8-aminopelargonate synthetase-like enzyme
MSKTPNQLIVERLERAVAQIGHAIGTAAGSSLGYEGLKNLLQRVEAEIASFKGRPALKK